MAIDLYDAVNNGDLTAVHAAIAAQADPLAPHELHESAGMIGRFFGSRGSTTVDTPLHAAIDEAVAGHKNSLAIVDALLATGVNVDATTRDRPAPIAIAVQGSHDHAAADELVRHLLRAGASAALGAAALPELRYATEHLGATEKKVVRQLLDANVGEPMLCAAAGGRDTPLTLYLLDSGVPVDAACPDGGTPLLAAAWSDDESLAVALVKRGADRGRVDAAGHTVYDRLTPDGDAAIVAAGRLGPRDEAALLAAWSDHDVDDALVASLPGHAVGQKLWARARENAGTAGLLAAYEEVGSDRLVALMQRPFAASLAGEALPWGCKPRALSVRKDVDALVGASHRVEHEGPIAVWAFDGGLAGYLRTGLTSRLMWIQLPQWCDPFGGAVPGLPRDTLRLGLGAPVAAWPDADVWPTQLDDGTYGRQAWLVVAYTDGHATGARVDWRHW